MQATLEWKSSSQLYFKVRYVICLNQNSTFISVLHESKEPNNILGAKWGFYGYILLVSTRRIIFASSLYDKLVTFLAVQRWFCVVIITARN